MKNLFTQTLAASNKAIKDKRAERVGKQASMAQTSLVQNLEKELMDLESKQEELEDLSPDNAYSLHATKGDFNAEGWVADLQKIQINILNKTLELEVAKKTQDKYFSEIKTKSK